MRRSSPGKIERLDVSTRREPAVPATVQVSMVVRPIFVTLVALALGCDTPAEGVGSKCGPPVREAGAVAHAPCIRSEEVWRSLRGRPAEQTVAPYGGGEVPHRPRRRAPRVVRRHRALADPLLNRRAQKTTELARSSFEHRREGGRSPPRKLRTFREAGGSLPMRTAFRADAASVRPGGSPAPRR